MTELSTRIFERSIPEPNSGCWLWTGHVQYRGTQVRYGTIRVDKRMELAHRASYRAFVGEIPEGLFVLHRCDVYCCTNPAHLFLGTHQDNMDDMIAKNRKAIERGEDASISKFTNQQVANILSDPRSLVTIAKDYNVTPSAIGHIKVRRTWGHVSPTKELVHRPNQHFRLNENDVACIRADNRPRRVLVKEYGVSARMIWLIKTNRAWRHVGMFDNLDHLPWQPAGSVSKIVGGH